MKLSTSEKLLEKLTEEITVNRCELGNETLIRFSHRLTLLRDIINAEISDRNKKF